jgi:uncharacterized membrane protein YhaH (DUF805 family)
MTFIESIRTCFSKYADFSGVAGRPEYWWWVLFNVIVSAVLYRTNLWLDSVFSLATFLPTIAVTARRLHDTNRSGWWQLLTLVPLIGWIVLIIWYCQGPVRPNRFELNTGA